MPSPRRLASVAVNRRVPLSTRRDLLRAEARRRVRPRAAYRVQYGPGRVLLSHDDYAIDWESLKFVVADHAYPADHAGAVVLDLGAHKGYYGAYALAGGARTVISFEPERTNAEYLERTAADYRARGADWRVRHAAVGASQGEAELHVMGASWGHGLHPPEEWAQYEVGVERVAVEAMADVLAEAASLAAETEGARLVVKLNVEGAECEIVLETRAEAWAPVSELFVEVHPWASCGAPELAAHLAPAGLSRIPNAMEAVLRLRRGGGPPADRRSAPR
jgi:FkbM family methyltransferase